jgi:assimilatory nitrate reductase catalytic subunit
MHAGTIKAVWIMGTNPVVSMPDADRVRAALARCELVVVCDCIEKTDTTAYAHVLLPAAGWGEKDGTVTNSERRISRQRAFLDLPGEARPDWWIVCEVARRMGFDFDFRTPSDIFCEHAKLSGMANEGARAFDISGLATLTASAYENLQPIQWPVNDRYANGAQRLFEDGRFMHPDGKARLIPTPPRAPAHAADEEFPMVLNTGRIRDQWHTMTRTGRSPRLAENLPEPFVDIHPQDALLTATREGELARVTTRWGSMVARVRSSGEIPRGTVFVPMHWNDSNASQARVGALVNPIVDSISGEPEFKHTPVRVEPFRVEWYGFVMSRTPLPRIDTTWWTRITGAHCTRYEIAGRDVPSSDWARSLVGATGEFIEYQNETVGAYRAAHIVGDRLEACVYIGELPDRGLIGRLFSLPKLENAHRLALMTTGAVVEGDDPGPLVCSCFAVGRNTILRAIEANGFTETRQVVSCLRAGGNCGSCLPEIKGLLGRTPNKIPVSISTASPLLT